MTSPDETTAVEAEQTEEPKKLSLEVKVESPSSCQRHVTVTVANEDVERYFDKAFDDMAPTAAVPGFRPGHAPRKLVEKRFRKEVANQVKGSLLMDSMAQASDEQNFSAISEPDFKFDAVELPEDGGPLTFEFDIEVRPEFDLPKWKGLEVKKLVKTFEKADIDKHLAKVLDRFSEIAPVDGPAEMDDYLTVNIVSKLDGKEIARAEDLSVRLRDTLSFQDANWEEFGKTVVGAKAGDKKTGKATVSEEAENEELKGKELELEIEVLEVKRLELPEMDGEFLKKIGGFESEGDLRDFVKGDMERQFEYHQQQQLRAAITEQLTKDANWDLPPALLRRQARRELERAVLDLRSYGFDEDTIRGYENTLRQNSLRSTEKALKEHFILERIAEEESIEDAPADYEREIMQIAAQSNQSPRSVRARLEKQGLMDTLRNQIIERKVIELITSEAKLNETPADAEAAASVAPVEFAITGVPAENAIPEAQEEGKEEA
ncbi:trigger factor [Blastopirellula sp. JC732]|uniref:Trigger factor n=1 Tax=Blastopirellula sediminis TaxID=2894196 RepID=A0A9X1MNI4_9BACT|nr:trigger factor [Blastopirellula sediminis]MCC9607170.1 trigger factor [Blastopirellula sediminis]MCC9629537.1 trigger factor [Blastopirellula sediminis]